MELAHTQCYIMHTIITIEYTGTKFYNQNICLLIFHFLDASSVNFFNEKCLCFIAAKFINIFICHCFYLITYFHHPSLYIDMWNHSFWNTCCRIVVLLEIWVVDETCRFFFPSIYRKSIFIVHKNLRFGIIYLILEYIQCKNLIPKNSCDNSSKVFL